MPEAITEVSLMNEALAGIGKAAIVSTSDQSAAAYYLNLFYDELRQEILREANWVFARRQTTPTLLSTSPIVNPPTSSSTSFYVWPYMPWSFEYTYPSDCLRWRRVIPPVPAGPFPLTTGPVTYAPVLKVPFVPFAVLNDPTLATTGSPSGVTVLCCNVNPIQGEYTGDITDTNIFDVGFRRGLVGRLAKKICQPLSGNLQLMQVVFQLGEDEIAKARAQDANETVVTQDHCPDYLRARWQGAIGPFRALGAGGGFNTGGWWE